jgi:hypothetical protein
MTTGEVFIKFCSGESLFSKNEPCRRVIKLLQDETTLVWHEEGQYKHKAKNTFCLTGLRTVHAPASMPMKLTLEHKKRKIELEGFDKNTVALWAKAFRCFLIMHEAPDPSAVRRKGEQGLMIEKRDKAYEERKAKRAQQRAATREKYGIQPKKR